MDVVGIGNPSMDFLVHTEKLPMSNQYEPLLEYGWQGGGIIATAIATVCRLGATGGVIGVVGDDPFSRFCIEDLKRHNVDTSGIVIDAGKTPDFCVCISESKYGSRCLIGRESTGKKLCISDINKDYITSAKYLHISCMDPLTRQAAHWAKENGVKVVIDTNYPLECNKDYELIDVFIASEYFYRALYNDCNIEKNCMSIMKKGPEIVVFTFGKDGCAGLASDGFFNLPASKVDVVDTTGAGDVFHGGFIYGLLQGWPTRYIAKFANAVSAIKCTRVGGRAGIPDLDTVNKFLTEGYIDYSEINKRVDFYRRVIPQ